MDIINLLIFVCISCYLRYTHLTLRLVWVVSAGIGWASCENCHGPERIMGSHVSNNLSINILLCYLRFSYEIVKKFLILKVLFKIFMISLIDAQIASIPYSPTL